MTDLATKPGAEDEASRPDDSAPAPAEGVSYAWAPAAKKPAKRNLALWIGVPVGAIVLGLAAASTVLIAPGTAVAGVPVGGLTAGAAADAIQARLDSTTVTLQLPAGDVTLTGAELGASVDARRLANDAFAEHPMWGLTGWFAPAEPATIAVDGEQADAALRAAAPAMYTEPVDATIAFDEKSAAYVATPAVLGEGIDLGSVQAALQGAFTAGERDAAIPATAAAVQALTPTYVAEGRADQLNGMLATAGFYVGAERTVPLDRAVVASWLTLKADERGVIQVTADPSEIQPVIDTLATAVNRKAVNATVITDSTGKVLKTLTTGVTGRTLGSTGGAAMAFAAQLAHGEGAYALPVTESKIVTTALFRRIEVDISQQRAYLFENEKVVQSWAISSGLPGHDTNQGHFRIYAQLRSQNMGDPDLIKADYYTPNVPFVSYFNGDEALHGAYWHHNFGHQMSHGCVNMPIPAAEYVYNWATIGTEVWVHA